MILLWAKKERVDFLSMFVFSRILPPALSSCPYPMQRDAMCTNLKRQSY